MKIREYMAQNNVTIKDISEHVGKTWQYCWMVISGRTNPGIQLAHQIEQMTGGKVKVHEIKKCTKICEPGCACSKGDRK